MVGNIKRPINGTINEGKGKSLNGPKTKGALENQSRTRINLGTNKPKATNKHIQDLYERKIYSAKRSLSIANPETGNKTFRRRLIAM